MAFSFSVWRAAGRTEHSAIVDTKTLGGTFSSLLDKKKHGMKIGDIYCGNLALSRLRKQCLQVFPITFVPANQFLAGRFSAAPTVLRRRNCPIEPPRPWAVEVPEVRARARVL